MKKSWYWVLLVFVGSLPIASALEYYVAGEPYRNTPTRNWLVIGQVIFGLVIIVFGLYGQIRASRADRIEKDEDVALKLEDRDH